MGMVKVGGVPHPIDEFATNNKTFMWVQYCPIKLAGQDESGIILPFSDTFWARPLVDVACEFFEDPSGTSQGGLDLDIVPYYIYLTVKSMWVGGDNLGNRPGWHIDGFGTEDHNFIWADMNPTEFWWDPDTEVFIPEDHEESMKAMGVLADAYPHLCTHLCNGDLIYLDNTVIHRPTPNADSGFRNFVKVTFSKERYLIEGNTKNDHLDYNWDDLRPRAEERNCPRG